MAFTERKRAGSRPNPAAAADDEAYHIVRARSERHRAYQLGDSSGSDAHMRLAALHLQRAIGLAELRRQSSEPAPGLARKAAQS